MNAQPSVLDRLIGPTPEKGQVSRGEFAPNAGYRVNDLVTAAGGTYVCIQATGAGMNPPVSPRFWRPFDRRDVIEQLKASIRRDLDALLNTRQTAEMPGPSFKEVRCSLLAYGLPDFAEERSADRIADLIKQAVDRFEPRLTVTVRPLPGPDPKATSSMRFRIAGSIRLRPAPEPVSYDTVVEIATGQCHIERPRGA